MFFRGLFKFIRKSISLLFLFSIFLFLVNSVEPRTPADIYEQCAPAVCQIISNYDLTGDIRGGTGFFISKNGFVVTASHVVYDNYMGKASLIIVIDHEKHVFLAIPYKIDLAHDVCVLELVREFPVHPGKLTHLKLHNPQEIHRVFPYLKIRPSRTLRTGERIVTIGYPNFLNPMISDGTLSTTRPVNFPIPQDKRFYANILTTNIVAYPGNSGGPILDYSGRVVGVLTVGSINKTLSCFQKSENIFNLVLDKSDNLITYPEIKYHE